MKPGFLLFALSLFIFSCSEPKQTNNIQPPPVKAVARLAPALPELAGRLVGGERSDELGFNLQWPAKGFGTQALDVAKIRFLRLWVRGAGISDRLLNAEGMQVLNPGSSLSLSVPTVPRGNNRIVTAQGYDENGQPIPEAILKGVYSSPPQGARVTVHLTWRFLPLGRVLERILDSASPWMDRVSADQLQAGIDQVIYGNQAPGGKIYAIHPSLLEPGIIASYLEAQEGRIQPAALVQAVLNASVVQPVIQNVQPLGGVAGNVITLTGTGFSGTTAVTLAGVPATFTIPQDTSLTFTVPPGAVSGPLIVTNPAGTAQKPFPIVPAANGDIRPYLIAIPIPAPNTNAFIEPSAGDMVTWKNVVTLARQGQDSFDKLGQAALLAGPLGYDGVIFTHLDGTRYYILYERPGPGFRGLGTYVFDLQPKRPILLGHPHPIFDQTRNEGITQLLAWHPRVLMFAGTHRCANCVLSPFSGVTQVCNGLCPLLPPGDNPFRLTDVAHYNNNFYHQAHEALIDFQPNISVFSIHGASAAGLGLDGGAVQLNAILSHGATEFPPPNFPVRQLVQQMEALNPALNAGVFPDDTLNLGATTNLQGRYVNKRSLATNCSAPACFANGLFIHIEQDLNLINNPQPLIDAVKNVFPG